MDKRRADYYLHRCYRLLADPDTVLRHKKLRGNLHGMAFSAVNSMTVDFRKDALSTILHECLHILYPDKPEKWILATEQGIVDNMTQLQFQNLCFRVACMGYAK